MKTMRKLALISAACLMLTALPLSAAAADDPVLTQVAAVKNDKFTVDAKKLGYTALNGECPERPVWFTIPENEKNNYENDVAGLESKLTPGQKNAADINGDGEVSVEDAQLILRYYTEKTVAGKDITWDDLLKQ